MAQVLMFALTETELKAKSKRLAAKELALIQAELDKDLAARQWNEKLKKLRGEIAQLAKEVDEEKASREATEAEAPWDGLLHQAQTTAARARTRRGRRDRTGAREDD
jgi:hypothetical protein